MSRITIASLSHLYGICIVIIYRISIVSVSKGVFLLELINTEGDINMLEESGEGKEQQFILRELFVTSETVIVL